MRLLHSEKWNYCWSQCWNVTNDTVFIYSTCSRFTWISKCQFSANKRDKWSNFQFHISAALILTGSGADGEVGVGHGGGCVGGKRRRWRRQLVVTWQAVLAGEDITCPSKLRPHPASTFSPFNISLVQQKSERLCHTVQSLLHAYYLSKVNKAFRMATFTLE